MADQFDATNARVLEAPKEAPAAGAEDGRPDIGSSIFIVFAPRFNAVVTGFSKEDLLYKLPCGKVEYKDIPDPDSDEFMALAAKLYGGVSMDHAELVRSVAGGTRLDYRSPGETNEESAEYNAFLSTIARNCALRELKAETDVNADELVHVGQLAYTRPIHKWDKVRKERKFIRQFHFFGILSRQNQLSRNCIEGSEMGDPEYWDPVDVLKWDVPLERKLNPFHRIAFAKCLIELRDQGVAEQVPDFAALLKRVADAGLDLDHYEAAIRECMKAHDPRT